MILFIISDHKLLLQPRKVAPNLAELLITVCPHPKFDKEIFTLREMIYLYALYHQKHAIGEDKSAQLSHFDPMFILQRRYQFRDDEMWLITFLMNMSDAI